jgi:predicted lipid-binding transport protein (Tim44 family)
MLLDDAKALSVSLINAFRANDTETLFRLLKNRTMQKGAIEQ